MAENTVAVKTREELRTLVIGVVVDQMGIEDSSSVDDDTKFGDIGDSLDAIEVISKLEDLLDITIPSDIELSTVGEAINYLADLMKL